MNLFELIFNNILRRLAVEPYGDFYIFLVCEMQGAILFSFFLFFEKKIFKKKANNAKIICVERFKRGPF